MKTRIIKVLDEQYRMQCDQLHEAQAGWSALAYKVASGGSNYFLKVYDTHQHTAAPWIQRIDAYMPVLLWLGQHGSLRGSVPHVVPTTGKDCTCRDDRFIYILFDHIEGGNLSDRQPDSDLIRELAAIIAELHRIRQIPLPGDGLTEAFDVSCAIGIRKIMDDKRYPTDTASVFTSHSDIILDRLALYERLAQRLRMDKPEFVLCHTDIHGWNIMQDRQLKLIDWEGVRFAPAEADLFSFTKGFFFGNTWDEFLSAYMQYRPEYRINGDALRFFRLRRLLEDIQAFSEGLMYNHLTGREREQSMDLLMKSCMSLQDV